MEHFYTLNHVEAGGAVYRRPLDALRWCRWVHWDCTGLDVSASLTVVRLTGEVIVFMVKLVGSTGLLDVHYFYSVQMNNNKKHKLIIGGA